MFTLCTLLLSTSCASPSDWYNLNLDVKNGEDDPIRIEVSTTDSLFQDIDGDGRKDMVYVIKTTYSETCERGNSTTTGPVFVYEVVMRRNLGDGNFGDETTILRTEHEAPKGIQILYERDSEGTLRRTDEECRRE